MNSRQGIIQRRSALVLSAVGLGSSIAVYYGHPWFHQQMLPSLGVSDALGDAIGGSIIILAAYLGQRIVSLALFHDTEHGGTLMMTQLERDNLGLKRELDELDHLASTDKLTGAWNRRRFDEAIPGEMDRLTRHGHPLSLLLLDIDFFKMINDRFGHDTGDRVLVALAGKLLSSLRTSDLLARWGGEEFIILCPNTVLSTASSLAERLCKEIAEKEFPEVGPVTVSIGVAECLPRETWGQWFQRADAALYQSKANGRNRIQIAPEVPLRGAGTKKTAACFLQMNWHEAYESGNETIDLEHRALFDRCNDLLAAMLSGHPADEVGSLVNTFIQDVVQHFRDEENIVAASGYPGTSSHALLHRELSAKALRLAEHFHDGTLEAGELFQFLAHDMVAKHVLGADREFFPYVTGIGSSTRLHTDCS